MQQQICGRRKYGSSEHIARGAAGAQISLLPRAVKARELALDSQQQPEPWLRLVLKRQLTRARESGKKRVPSYGGKIDPGGSVYVPRVALETVGATSVWNEGTKARLKVDIEKSSVGTSRARRRRQAQSSDETEDVT